MPAPDPDHASIDSSRFRQVLGHFASGITVIAGEHEGERVGLAVASFFSLSLDPPLVGFCAGHQSSSWPKIRAAGSFCVNILAADQEEVCRAFAAPGPDKFAGVGYDAAPWSGAPRIHDVLAWIDCEIHEVLPGGDHDIVIGRVHDLGVADEGHPLVVFRGGYGSLAP